MTRPRIYVAGKYSAPTKAGRQQNAERAILFGQTLLTAGYAPFVPHLSHWWEELFPGANDWDTWLELDEPWVEVSDALVRIPGQSAGADREVITAERAGIPVFYAWPDSHWLRALELSVPPSGQPADVSSRKNVALVDYFRTAPVPAAQAKPESILAEAQRLIYGDRQGDYGPPIQDFARTGRMWAAILGVEEVTPAQVGLCMVALKLSRQCHKSKRDNLVDACGYLGTVAMIEGE